MAAWVIFSVVAYVFLVTTIGRSIRTKVIGKKVKKGRRKDKREIIVTTIGKSIKRK